ncbi:putative cyclin-A3-1 [Bombyx mandarina]|uniref:Cyclin-A3-1 n=1 Tax=Bombyx mandarina TaxID=7092 RepID=A0A6J2KCL5_BOMMA|nr:putative cyclin-A3-1 [Bombyx mandarina]
MGRWSHGLKEGEKTTEQLLKNTKEVFLKTLNINIQDCEINKIYRIGKEIKGNKPRPTLLSFVSGLKKNEILRNKKKSKEITFTEDYSKDILEKRKALIPQLTEERNKGKIAYLKYDQLIVKEKSNTYYEKRKREVSTSPQYSQPKKQQISSSSKEIVNVYDMMRASKYEEVYPPEVSEFVYITDDTYTKREVLRMEHLILKVLSFDLSTPTSLAFLSHYCISNGLSKKTFHLASYIAELCLLEADPYLQFKPSVIAASALATARHCLLCEQCACDPQDVYETRDAPGKVNPQCAMVAWPSTLSTCSGYTLLELETCLKEIARTHSHASVQPYQAIPDKYKSNKFEGVSQVEPRPMFPVGKYQAPAAARPPPAADSARATS